MSYFDYLNEDILSNIFSYLDTYDILKLCDISYVHKSYIINKIMIDIENKPGLLHQCIRCNAKCMNIKHCVDNDNHKLCYNCVGKCDFCEKSIGLGYCGCYLSNVTRYINPVNYGPYTKCSCEKKACRNCLKTDWMSYIRCPDCHNDSLCDKLKLTL